MSLLTLTFCNTINKYAEQQSVPEVYEFVGSMHTPIQLKGKENITVIQLLISIYYHIKKIILIKLWYIGYRLETKNLQLCDVKVV